MTSLQEWSLEGYRVIELLGRGRRGEVARAEALADGRSVLIERTVGASRRQVARFRQELTLLSGLEHPGLAPIRALGGEGRLLWWVFDALEGASLRRIMRGSVEVDSRRAWWSDLWGLPEGIPFSPLRLARLVGEALAYLHGEGRVHGALRPESILVRSDGTPVLVDLGPIGPSGLGGHASRPNLEVPAFGDVAYLPPEKIQGEPYDARGDLYSLGCILYEMMTGRPPFVGEPHRVVEQHLRDRVTPPSLLAEGLPQPLERLILQLLRKQPEARPGYAAIVSRALAAIEGVSEEVGAPMLGRPYLYRPVLAGRGLMLSKLKAVVSATADRRGLFLLLEGEAGSGRSRVLEELRGWASRSLCEVFAGACRPPGSVRGRQALGPLRSMAETLYERCRSGGPEVTVRLLGNEGKVISILEPLFADLPALESMPAPTELAPLPARRRLFVAVLTLLERLSQARPLLAIVEDIEWADPWTCELLTFLARVQPERPRRWTILATCRDDQPETPTLRALHASPAISKLRMEPLDVTTLTDVVGSMLAWPAPPTEFVRWLFERSAGRPLYACELLRSAVSEGRLSLAPEGGWQIDDGEPLTAETAARLALPATLEGLIRRRLGPLEPAARELLELAALLGLYFRAEWLEAAASPAAWAALDELARLRLLVLGTSGDLRLGSAAVREVVLADLEPGSRKDRHLAVARALLAASAAEADLATDAGFHFEAADHPDEARGAYARAAREADERGDFFEARRLLLAHLELVREPTLESVRARIRLADIEAAAELPHEALEHSRMAHLEAEALGAQLEAAEAQLVLARALDGLGVGEETLECLQRAGELFDALGDRAGRARGLVQTAQVHRRLERRDLALRTVLEALSLYRELGDAKQEGATLLLAGSILQRMGHSERAEQLFAEALDLNRAAQSFHAVAASLANLGLLARDRGDNEDAAALISQALELYGRIGDLPNQGAMHRYLGLLAYATERYEESIAHLDHARVIARDVDAERDEAVVLSLLTVAQLERGATAEALLCCEAALELHRRHENRSAESHALSCLAQIRYAQRDYESAARLFEQASAIDREVGSRAMRGVNLVGLAMCTYRRPGAGAEERQRADELFQQGLAAHRAQPNVRNEAYTLIHWAAFNRRQGRISRARRQLDEARELLDRSEVPYCRALLVCEDGHLALSEGGRADDHLTRAAHVADSLGLLPNSEVGRRLDRLAQAEIARVAGQPLVNGESL